MSASSSPRTVRSGKGYRVIRRVRQSTAEAPRAGLFGRLWQRLRALLKVTPEQWHAHELTRRAGLGDGLRAGALVGGQIVLMSSPAPLTSERRPAQPDLP